jgi:scyllo-inositol 2-dehydrogenase (NADP+)
MSKETIRVGLIGYGMGGRFFHAPILTSVPGLYLKKIVATRPESIANIEENYPGTEVVSSIEAIFADPDIQLVVVATPNVDHFEHARRALESGKHVVVEKPFTVTSQEADQLIAIANRTGKLLTAHHNRRWDSDFRTVEKILRSNLLGELVEYEAHFDRYWPALRNSWKEKKTSPGANVLFNLGPHLIDQALCLFGLPEEIFGQLDIQRQKAEIADSFEMILRYPGLKVTLKSGMLVREAGPHFTLHGHRGSFIKFGMDVQEQALASGHKPNDSLDWGREPEDLQGKINTEVHGIHFTGKVESETGDYRKYYRNVYQAIIGQAALAVTPQQARQTIRIIELAEQSHAEKRWMRYT